MKGKTDSVAGLAHFQPHERAFFELVAYYVAQGRSASQIEKILAEQHGMRQDDNQIYRAVYQAAKHGLLHYVPTRCPALEEKVESLAGRAVRVTVVGEEVVKHGAFEVVAAQALYDAIAEQSTNLPGQKVLVANAGGPTVAAVVRELARQRPDTLPGGRELRIESIALSQVGFPDRFSQTSTHLAARLAEIFGGEEFIPLMGNSLGEVYAQKLAATRVFVSGVGAPGRGYWVDRKQELLPDSYQGDLFYIPLCGDGDGGLQPDPELEDEARQLSLRPTFAELRSALARKATVLLLATDDAEHRKAGFLSSVLRNRLATHVVMGEGLARSVLKANGMTVPRPAGPAATAALGQGVGTR